MQAAPSTELQFLGQQIFPTATQFQGTTFGGLSGIAYDERRDVFYVISDDRRVRFYTLRIGVSSGAPAVQILAVTSAARRLGPAVRAAQTVDPEGLALTKDDTSSSPPRASRTRLIDPWVREFRLDGRQLADAAAAGAFLPNADGTRRRASGLRLRERGIRS